MQEKIKEIAVSAMGETNKLFAFLDVQVVFWTFTVIGVISSLFLMVTLLLGELSDVFHAFGGDHDIGHGDHGADTHHGGDVHTGETDQTGGTPSLFSLRFGFSFLSGFGVTGAVATYTGCGVVSSSLLGAAIGLVLTSLTYAFVRGLASQQASFNITNKDFIGTEARVINDIPKGGMGQVIVQVGEMSVSKLAQSEDGQAIPENTRVMIVSTPGQMVIVKRIQPV